MKNAAYQQCPLQIEIPGADTYFIA